MEIHLQGNAHLAMKRVQHVLVLSIQIVHLVILNTILTQLHAIKHVPPTSITNLLIIPVRLAQVTALNARIVVVFVHHAMTAIS